jgi:purine nucleoside permease
MTKNKQQKYVATPTKTANTDETIKITGIISKPCEKAQAHSKIAAMFTKVGKRNSANSLQSIPFHNRMYYNLDYHKSIGLKWIPHENYAILPLRKCLFSSKRGGNL